MLYRLKEPFILDAANILSISFRTTQTIRILIRLCLWGISRFVSDYGFWDCIWWLKVRLILKVQHTKSVKILWVRSFTGMDRFTGMDIKFYRNGHDFFFIFYFFFFIFPFIQVLLVVIHVLDIFHLRWQQFSPLINLGNRCVIIKDLIMIARQS